MGGCGWCAPGVHPVESPEDLQSVRPSVSQSIRAVPRARRSPLPFVGPTVGPTCLLEFGQRHLYRSWITNLDRPMSDAPNEDHEDTLTLDPPVGSSSHQDIKSSSSHPLVILKSSSSHPQVILKSSGSGYVGSSSHAVESHYHIIGMPRAT